MILFPAIDLKEGQCVRLAQGDMTRATVFNDNPAEQARIFESQGFEYLHVVDLDGAFAGAPRNARAVEAVLAAIRIPVQLGGGIRDMRTITRWLERGVARVIIGTAAVKDPALVREAARVYPGRIAVGIDAKDGFVAVEGWARSTRMSAQDLARGFEDAGVAAIIYTDIARDGILKGLNIEATLALADALTIPVIASGGLASLQDVERLLQKDCAKLAGAITGRALYDGRLDPAQALALIGKARAANSMKPEETFRSWTSRAGVVRVSTSLNPLLWILAPVMPTSWIAAYFFQERPELLYALIALGALPVILSLAAYFIYMFRDPNRLQSQEYLLRHQAMELLYQKDATSEIVDVITKSPRLGVEKHAQEAKDGA